MIAFLGKLRKHGLLLLTFLGLLVLICFALLLIPESQMPTILQSSGLVAIISAFLGVFMTVAVTSILLDKQAETQKELLDKQSKYEEEKERSTKIFEKKQEVYHDFLKKLESIIQGGEIRIGCKKEDGTIYDLKDLIFQLGYLQMHTSKETINSVLNQLVKIIQCLNDYNSIKEQDNEEKMSNFYSSLSNAISTIVSILREDLYGEKTAPIAEKTMKEILRECGVLEFEKMEKPNSELQLNFWNKLREQLKKYKVNMEENFEDHVEKYYDSSVTNRYFLYGIEFEVARLKDNTPVIFRITIDNDYFYGFPRTKESPKNELISNCVKEIPGSTNARWFRWKYPTDPKLRLNFWYSTPKENFDKLKEPGEIDKFILEIGKEIDEYIKDFLKKAKESNIIK
jgi:Asp-tRNA(Asn)/Glu-tRNA(Gln) amidotransferase C subunit